MVDVSRNKALLLLFVFIIAAGVLAAVSYFGYKMVVSNGLKGDVYETSLMYINEDKAIKNLIGAPVTPGFIVSGEKKLNGADGQINLKFSIVGNNGKGDVNVYAFKEEDHWKLFEVIVICCEPKQRIHVYSPHWKPRHNEKLLKN